MVFSYILPLLSLLILYRGDSDEFVCFLYDTDENSAEDILNRIIGNFYRMNRYKNFSLHPETASWNSVLADTV